MWQECEKEDGIYGKKRTQQGKLTNLEIASFCSEMAMILKSGISSLEGVDLLREDAQTKAEKSCWMRFISQ